ncbi:hypothetical protein K439DRAFT_1645329 [Ramaria rubella]|nr:hypothetical protein K439DRAFT_1645329 [Ramaria rubella]
MSSFMRLETLMKPAIAFQLFDISTPPSCLPLNIHTFLTAALDHPWDLVQQCWEVFAEEIWSSTSAVAATREDREHFCHFGLPQGLGMLVGQMLTSLTDLHFSGYRDMYPPTCVCLQHICANFCLTHKMLMLRQPARYEAMLFTKGKGTLPIFSHSTYSECFTRYHSNFYVNKQASTCTYYEGIPDVIQVSQWYYLEMVLLELQANEMCFAWESSENCARTYNQALQMPNAHQANNGTPEVPLLGSWVLSLTMSGGHVLDGFLLYSLLLDKAEHNETLVMPHDAASQKLHLEPVMAERNVTMEGIGQEHYAHACDLCGKMYENDEGELVKLQGAGITIGHPCCVIHDCKIPLENASQDVYCPAHLRYESKCAVTVCESFHEVNFEAYREKGSTFFQDGEYAIMVEGKDNLGANPVVLECDEKAVQGNCKLHAQFGRRHIHNKQLIIRPCGVIISRATFFGSEAISLVREFVLATFPTPESMPKAFFYDTNCGLLKHCRSIGCHRFDQTAIVVDVFHFTWKHKVSDGFCQENCNPAMFPELYVNGKWVFNSSVAEQTNISAMRFNFFLDEMIKRHNCYTIMELKCKGHNLWTIPWQALFFHSVPGGKTEPGCHAA